MLENKFKEIRKADIQVGDILYIRTWKNYGVVVYKRYDSSTQNYVVKVKSITYHFNRSEAVELYSAAEKVGRLNDDIYAVISGGLRIGNEVKPGLYATVSNKHKLYNEDRFIVLGGYSIHRGKVLFDARRVHSEEVIRLNSFNIVNVDGTIMEFDKKMLDKTTLKDCYELWD